MCRRPISAASTTGSPRTERTVTLYSPGREPVAPPAPTRSTRSSTAISRPAASAGPAWGRSRSPASRTRWAGARSAASPTSSPRIWTSTTRPISTACAASGTRRAWRPRPGLKAVDLFDAVARRAGSRRCGSWHQPGRQHAATPTRVRAALAACPFVVGQRLLADRHDALRRCRAAGRRLGREGRHGHQFGAAHLAPARLPRAARRGAARLVDADRSRAPAWAGTSAFAYRRPAEIFREHAALSAFRERRRPGLRHRRAGRD